MTGFWFGLTIGIAIATAVAVYHAYIVTEFHKVLNSVEQGAKAEGLAVVGVIRKHLGF